MGKLSMLGALICWGIWGFASNIAVSRIHPFTMQWLYAIPYIILMPLWIYLSRQADPVGKLEMATYRWAFLACIMTTLAVLCFNTALKYERPSMVVAVTSAYPLVTIALLALSGADVIRWQHFAGGGLIVSGVVLMQWRF